jgi:hypothetical protein
VVRYAPILALTVIALACGDSPNNPGPIVNPPPPPPVNNTAPTITAITVQGTRRNEPANFADVGESVPVAATVTDPETNVDLLQYNWTATLGTFTGTGARVSWVAPAAAVTPATVTITLEVVERFGTNQENRVNRTATIALHDSLKEVGDMARQFLLEFSDSSMRDSALIVRNFTDATKTCADGKAAESSEITRNRVDYRITSASIGNGNVTIDFGGRCAFRNKPGDACARVPVAWTSTRLTSGGATPVGGTERVAGAGQVTAVYLPTQGKWGLCESDFDGVLLLRSTFIR